MNFLFLLAQAEPPRDDEWFYPLVFPALALAAGLFFFFKAQQMDKFGAEYKPKVLALPLFLLSIALGLYTLSHMTDTIYRMAILDMGRKQIMVHILAPSMGLIGIALVVRQHLMNRTLRDTFTD